MQVGQGPCGSSRICGKRQRQPELPALAPYREYAAAWKTKQARPGWSGYHRHAFSRKSAMSQKWFIVDLWEAAKATRASSSGPISRICRRLEDKASQTRMVWSPSTRLFPQIRDEPPLFQGPLERSRAPAAERSNDGPASRKEGPPHMKPKPSSETYSCK